MTLQVSVKLVGPESAADLGTDGLLLRLSHVGPSRFASNNGYGSQRWLKIEHSRSQEWLLQYNHDQAKVILSNNYPVIEGAAEHARTHAPTRTRRSILTSL